MEFDQPQNVIPTAILDYEAPSVAELSASIPGQGRQAILRAAHAEIVRRVRPVYTLDELQPASVTLAKGMGSCSQRMALLEAMARARAIPTRCRALWVDGHFWNGRFCRPVHRCLPDRILIAWPQFGVLSSEAPNRFHWIDFEEIFGPVIELATRPDAVPFANDGETMFEAIAHTPVDLLGKTECADGICGPAFNLSRYLLADDGLFESRDEIFATYPLLQDTWRGQVFETIWGGRKSN